MSTAELRQRDKYIEAAFGIKRISTRLIPLEKQLGLQVHYNPNSIDDPKYGVDVLFAVGNGARKHCDTYQNNKVTWQKFVGNASIAQFSDLENHAGLFGGLDDPRYIHTMPASDVNFKRYRMYKPFISNNKWVRRFFAKLPESVSLLETVDDEGFPIKVQHIICRITKDDLKPYTQAEIAQGSGVINELCVYFGQKVAVFKTNGNDSTSYLLLDHPVVENIDVEPYFRVVFDDIKIDDIPQNGLDFMFDIELHVAELQDDEEPPPDDNYPGDVVIHDSVGHIAFDETIVPPIVIPVPPVNPPIPDPIGDIVIGDDAGFIILDETIVPPIVIPVPPPPIIPDPTGDVVIGDDAGFIILDEIIVPPIIIPEPPAPPYLHVTGDVTIEDDIGNVATEEISVPPIVIPVPPYIHIEGDVTVGDDVGNIAINEVTVPPIVIPEPPPYSHVTGDVTIEDDIGNIATDETIVPPIDIPEPPVVPPYIHIEGDITIEDGIGNIATDEIIVPPIIIPVPPYIHIEGDITIEDEIGNTAIDEVLIPIPPTPDSNENVHITDDSGTIGILETS